MYITDFNERQAYSIGSELLIINNENGKDVSFSEDEMGLVILVSGERESKIFADGSVERNF